MVGECLSTYSSSYEVFRNAFLPSSKKCSSKLVMHVAGALNTDIHDSCFVFCEWVKWYLRLLKTDMRVCEIICAALCYSGVLIVSWMSLIVSSYSNTAPGQSPGLIKCPAVCSKHSLTTHFSSFIRLSAITSNGDHSSLYWTAVPLTLHPYRGSSCVRS